MTPVSKEMTSLLFVFYTLFPIVLDISNHTQVYKSVLLLLLSMARNQSCRHLLFLKINLQSDDDDDQFDKSRAIKSRRNLANLVQRLNGIAQTYLKTLKYDASYAVIINECIHL